MNRRGIITIGTLLIILLATPFAGTAIIRMQTAGQIYETLGAVPQKELGLVLGAAAYGDRLSDALRDRVDTALELFHNEKISAIVMSGAPNEVQAMKKYALERKVPEQSIIEDITGLNTLASVRNVSELNRSVTIVTQKYHLPRPLFIAGSLGLDAVGMAADKGNYAKIFDFKAREIAATSKMILDLFILD